MAKVTPLGEREAYIKALVEESLSGPGPYQTITVEFKDQLEHLPVVRCDINKLVYRLSNGRTDIQQGQYMAEHGLEPEFFLEQESEAVQKAQGSILLRMADEKGLREDLLTKGQRDPLIITRQAVVVNGNRRLSVCRDDGVDYVNCAVLPGGDEKDYDLLETELQISQDFKAEYNWVNKLKKIRKLNAIHGLTPSQIRDKMRLKSSQEVNTLLEMLDLIDLYLERNGMPGEYYRVGPEKTQQAFLTTAERHKAIKNPVMAEKFRDRAFTLIDSPPREGRLYDHLSYLAKNLSKIVERDEASCEVEDEAPDQSLAKHSEPEPSDALFDDPLAGIDSAGWGAETGPDWYSSPDSSAEKATHLVNLIGSVKAETEEAADAMRAFKKAEDALARLTEALPDESSTHLREMLDLLSRIMQKAQDLEIEVARLLTRG